MHPIVTDVAWFSVCWGTLVTLVSPAITSEQIEMGMWTRVGPGHHVLAGGLDPPLEGAVSRMYLGMPLQRPVEIPILNAKNSPLLAYKFTKIPTTTEVSNTSDIWIHLTCIGVIGLHCHGLHGSASPVLTATGFVNGRWQFSTPPTESTPITKKFGTRDYVGGPYGCAKFGTYLSMGASGQMGEI